MSTSGRVYDDFVRLLFLHSHRETSILVGELPEESEQFRFFQTTHMENIKDSRFDSSQILRNEGYYSHRFVYVSFHTFTSFDKLSSS